MRQAGRKPFELRSLQFKPAVAKYAEGSCLTCFGDTHVLCTATVEEKVPFFLKNSGKGWITAEYGMLPRATQTRNEREAAQGKQTGRTQEIQRLIGRALRAVVDLNALGERQIRLDCDVLQADGGTRTAAISGAFIALHLALQKMVKNGKLTALPLTTQVAAISCGLVAGTPLLDLDYAEDSTAEADINVVLSSDGNIIEIQGTAETRPFSPAEFSSLLTLAQNGLQDIFQLQREILNIAV